MASFGETLRRERESRKISLSDVAKATKIGIRFLEALEENRFEILPGGVFNKGFVRACAVHLGLDAEATVGHYLREAAQRPALGFAGPATAATPVATGAVSGTPAPPAPLAHAPAPARTAPAAAAEVGAPTRVISIANAPAPLPVARPAAPRAMPGPGISPSPTITFASEEPATPRKSHGLVIALAAVAVLGLVPLGLRMFRTEDAPVETEPILALPATTREAVAVSWEPSPAALAGPEAGRATGSLGPAEQVAGAGAIADPGTVAGQGPLAGAGTITGAKPPADPLPSWAKHPPPPRPAPLEQRHPLVTKSAPARAKPTTDPAPPSSPVPRGGEEPPRPPPAAPLAAGTAAPPPATSHATPGIQGGPETPQVLRRAVPAPGAAAPQPETMSVQIDSARKNWVYLFCDSREVIDRNMLPGESLKFECLSVVRVSSHDAGAVNLTINGARCMPLGDDGAEVYGYTIRVDDFRLICPRRPLAAGGRP